ncbi:hypothetical protein D3C85_1460550 [compost metagenome]
MCAHTGTPRSASRRMVSASQAAPSILIMWAPACISVALLAKACSGVACAMNGRSARISAPSLPRLTLAVW